MNEWVVYFTYLTNSTEMTVNKSKSKGFTVMNFYIAIILILKEVEEPVTRNKH